MKITYLYNSGFALETDNIKFVFDYYMGELPTANVPTIFFASHSHPDHFSKSIFIRRGKDVVFVLSGEIPENDRPDVIKLREGESAVPLPGIKVKAFGSTDLGVSFMVSIGSTNIFHAGDYNLWHWKNESTADEIAEAETLFYRVLDTLMPYKDKIDLAFFPIDGRMGEGTEEGARIFAETLRPKILIPMHFGSNTHVPIDAARVMEKLTKYVVLAEPGESTTIE